MIAGTWTVYFRRLGLALGLLFGGAFIMAWAWPTGWKIGHDPQTAGCLPWSFYVYDHSHPKVQDLHRGDLIVFEARHLRFFKDGMHMDKLVVGLPGDVLEVRQDVAYINGRRWGKLWLRKTLGGRPGQFDRKVVVPAGQVAVMGTEPPSYDSRYWGFLSEDRIIGRARLLF